MVQLNNDKKRTNVLGKSNSSNTLIYETKFSRGDMINSRKNNDSGVSGIIKPKVMSRSQLSLRDLKIIPKYTVEEDNVLTSQ
jgi:hypothetical protein